MAGKAVSRKQRENASNTNPLGNVPLALPNRPGPVGKSLIDIATERQDALISQADTLNEQRRLQSGDGSLGDSLLIGVSLSMVNFTLDVLVYHQYAQNIDWNAIIWRFVVMLPSMSLIVYVFHLPPFMRLSLLRQATLLAFSCTAGCWLVRTSNQEAYMAVMRKAPPLGTILVWSFIEMRIPFAIAGLACVGAYIWLNDYSII